MMTTTIRFTGKSAEGKELYRSYYLVADDDGSGGAGKSSIIPMSAQAAMPDTDHFTVKSGGGKAALEYVIKLLSELPSNQGLSFAVDHNPG
jgi:hypothetical protein